MKKPRKPRPRKNKLPKGAYRLPGGGFAQDKTSTTTQVSNGKQRRIIVRSVRRENPDLRGLSRVLLDMARVDRDAEQAESSTPTDSSPPPDEERRAA